MSSTTEAFARVKIDALLKDEGWNATETAAHLGCERGTLSRLLNGRAGVSANMALENIGWGTAEHWMRMQAGLRACTGASGEDCRRTACGRAARMTEPRASAGGRGTVPAPVLHPLSANGKPFGARRRTSGAA